MTHAHWFSAEIMFFFFFQTKYEDRIKERGASINELYLNNVNENMQSRDTFGLNFVNPFLFEQQLKVNLDLSEL